MLLSLSSSSRPSWIIYQPYKHTHTHTYTTTSSSLERLKVSEDNDVILFWMYIQNIHTQRYYNVGVDCQCIWYCDAHTTNRNKWHFSNNSSENVIANAAFHTWCTQVTRWTAATKQQQQKNRNKWNKFNGSTYELHRLNNLSSVDRADICFSNEQTHPKMESH